MIDFLWDLNQQKQISEAKAEAGEAKRDAAGHARRLEQLEFSLQRMALVSQALWELLRSRFDLSEKELTAKMAEIDFRDGILDGRMSPQRITCPSCSRTLNSKNTRCIYCGTIVSKPHVFE